MGIVDGLRRQLRTVIEWEKAGGHFVHERATQQRDKGKRKKHLHFFCLFPSAWDSLCS